MVNEVDFYFCSDGTRHDWEYRGKRAQSYRCWHCGITVTKAALKGGTDA